MAQTIKLKRSNTADALPTTAQLASGELAMNTRDGKVYMRKYIDGTNANDTIVQISGSGSSSVTTGTSDPSSDLTEGDLFYDTDDDIFKIYTSSAWKSLGFPTSEGIEFYEYDGSDGATYSGEANRSFSGNDNSNSSLKYIAGFLEVYLNGVRLQETVDFVATDGVTLILEESAENNDILQITRYSKFLGNGDNTVDTFTVASSAYQFTLSVAPASEANTAIYVDGVYQNKTSYSLSGTTLDFGSGNSPGNGAIVEAIIFSSQISAENPLSELNVAGNSVLGTASGATATGTAIKDEDNMASDSASHLATQQSIKAYVDTRILTEDTLAELNDTNITTPADASLLLYDTGTSTWRDAAMSGNVTITDTGVTTVATLNQNTTGTAATVTGAAQTAITSLGTLSTLTVDDITINDSTISDASTLTVDAGGQIVLDADGGLIQFKDGGTEIAQLKNSSSDFQIISIVADKDIIFRGNDSDGGGYFNALTLDMSNAGAATFNNTITANSGGGNAVLGSHLDLGDNQKARFGASDDLQIYHSGAHSFITDGGTGDLKILGANIEIGNTGAVLNFKGISAGASNVYHNGNLKLATNSGGITVTGTAILGGASFVDNATAYFGTGLDLRIYHSGTHSFIKDVGTGNLYIDVNEFYLRHASDDVVLMQTTSAGAVQVKHNGSLKLETTSTGVDVTGVLNVSGNLTVAGTTTTFNSATLTVDDKNIELGSVATPTDTTADGGGITLKGASDKTILWTNSTNLWHFNQGLRITGELDAGNGTYGAKLTYSAGNNTGILDTFGNHALEFRINNDEKGRWLTNGNLGIGTASPDARLQVNVTDTDATPVSGTDAHKARSSHSLELINDSDSAIYSGIHLRTRSNGAAAWSINNVWKSTYLGDLTFVSRTGGSTAAEHMRITDTGKVGIGTPSPDHTLHVLSTSDSMVELASSHASPFINFARSGARTAYIQHHEPGASGTGEFRFGTGSSHSPTNTMTISYDNKVGIGTTTPAQLLEVRGNAAKARFTRSGSAGTNVEFYYGGTQAGGIQVQTAGLGISGAARENDLFITTSGKVCVGRVATLGYALDVLGDVNFERSGTSDQMMQAWRNGNGVIGQIRTSGSDLELQSAGDLILDATGNDIILKDGSTTFGQITNDSGNLIIYNAGSQMLKGLSTGSDAQFMGNVGIGLTPTIFSSRKSLDIGLGGKIWGHTSATETGIGSNFYFDGAYKRTSANAATRHIQDGNGHTFDVAASGSADATISWTTAMTIDPAGKVGINDSSPSSQLVLGGGRASEGVTAGGNYFEITRATGGDAGVLFTTPHTKWLVGVDNSYGNTGPLLFEYGAYNASIHPGLGSGTLALALSYNGLVGINTPTPDAHLSIDSNIGAGSTGYLARFHASKGESDSTYLQIAATRHGTASVQRVQLQAFDDDGTTGRTLSLNPSGGSVGIGVNDPSQALQVNGNIRINQPDNGGAPADTAIMEMYGYEGRGVGLILRDSVNSASGASNREWFMGSGYATSAFTIGYASDGSQSSYLAQNKLIITTDGRVGIGTTSINANSVLEVNGRIRFATGSTALPALSCFSDLDTGFSFPTSDVIIVSTAGEERWRWDSSGNVLMQSGSPEIHFGTTSASHANWRIACQEAVSDAFEIASGTQSAGSGAASDTYTTRFVIKNTGNVGIGTPSPATELQIGDYTDNAETLTFATASDQTGRINFYNANSSEGASMRVTGGGLGAKMIFANRYTTDTDRVAFDLVNGRVGIGTASPYYTLDVRGGNSTNGDAKNLALIFDTTSAAAGTGGGIAFGGYTNGTGTDINHFGNIQGIKENSTAGNYASALLFSTRANGATPAEQMRITSGGIVLFGRDQESVNVAGGYIDGGEAIMTIANGGNTYLVRSTDTSAYTFYVGGDGEISAVTTSITSLSDERLKENIVDLETGLTEIMALKPRRFDWKEGEGSGKKNISGFVAQEVETVLPDLIGDYKHEELDDAKTVRMGDMLPTLVKAIQELTTKLEAAEARIAALEA